MDNKIARDLYNNLGNINRHTIRVEHELMIENITDRAHFLLFNMKNFDSRYVISLLLTFPNLLFALSASDWVTIIQESLPKKKVMVDQVFKNMNDDGEFFDLIFLNRYLEINPFHILKSMIKIEQSELINCTDFFKMYEYKFFNRNEIESDLNDFYSINKQELMNYSDKLIKSGFKKGFESAHEMNNYLSTILK